MLLFFIKLVLVQGCPTMTCGETEKGVCAVINGDSITLGTCTGKYECNLQDVIEAYKQGKSTVPCAAKSRDEPYQYSINITKQIQSIYSGDEQLNKKRIDKHPRACSSNSDCRLTDGTQWFCQCAFNGKSYCQYAYHDDIYKELRQFAFDANYPEFMMTSFYIQTYPFNLNLPECANGRFLDVKMAMAMATGFIEFEYFEPSFSLYLGLAGVAWILL